MIPALPIIEVRSIGKKYTISHLSGGYVALRDVLAGMFRNPFRYLYKRAARLNSGTTEPFWALKDVSFSVMPGESIGVIGSNGAGKSTLLKILTGITPPTEGEITMRGRVASMLEVGTGFHPELTGRENIYLNGAILGMSRKELEQKFEAIVTFAGVDQFLDTPVKHYSSGMYVRLAFSVAAHLEPDILLIDEVLAVGDAEFQKKCLGKMDEVTKKDGRTILFVSHNLAAVQSLCSRAVLLEQGKVVMVGDTKDVIDRYIAHRAVPKQLALRTLPIKNGDARGTLNIMDVMIYDTAGRKLIQSDSKLRIAIRYESDFVSSIEDVRVLISIVSERSQQMLVRLDSHGSKVTLKTAIAPSGTIVCETGSINLVEGAYTVTIQILPQKPGNGHLNIETNFEVITNLEAYGFDRAPDNKVCEYLVPYAFSQD